MRKLIYELANGKMNETAPMIHFSTPKVECEVLEGQTFQGSFEIKSTNEIPVRGLVISSDARMKCLNDQFEGTQVTIQFEFHSEGLLEGDIQKGEFCIICNRGEYSLSFVAVVSKPYAASSEGLIHSIRDFSTLALTHREEALRIFQSRAFQDLFSRKEKREQLLYKSLCESGNKAYAMENFLVATGRKQNARFAIQELEKTYYEILTPVKESIGVTIETEGWIEICVSSDASFLKPVKTIISTDDFIGKEYDAEFVIDAQEMHAGNNYGKISFHTLLQTIDVEVMATCNAKDYTPDEISYELKKGRVDLSNLYLDYRLKKIVTGEWAGKSIEILKHMQSLEPDNDWYALVQAQCLLVNSQKQDALWILEDFKRQNPDTHTPMFGYYLYLCTLAQREKAYVDKVTELVEQIGRSYPNHPLLFWILLFLKEEYCAEEDKRYKAIEERFLEGSRSPFFYMEAYYLLWSNPYLLVKLSKFEVQILFWAAKHDALSRDLALQIMTLVTTKRAFDPVLYRLLCLAYERYPKEEMVQTVCAYLIRCQCFSKKYFYWYEKGIELNLRITGLNEAYVMSMDMRQVLQIPRIVQMYFQYRSVLPYEKKAELFASIYKAKEEDPGLYVSYRKQMELFALEQMEAGHIDANLALLYDTFLSEGMLNADVARMMSELFFVHKVHVASPDIVRIYVLHPQLMQSQQVSVIHGEAYVRLFTTDYCLVLEDKTGKRYGAMEEMIEIERFLNPANYLRKCIDYVPDELSYLLRYFDGKLSFHAYAREDIGPLLSLLASEDITASYRAKLIPEAIRFFDLWEEEEYVDFYLNKADFSLLEKNDRNDLVRLMIDHGMLEYAYEVVSRFGYELIDPAKLIPLCSYKIDELGGEEDEFLLALCAYAFSKNKFSSQMLSYLAGYFGGKTKTMADIWQNAVSFEVDTRDLEERLLTQMLYTEDFPRQSEEIYESFVRGGGRDILIRAYLNFMSHGYLVYDVTTPEQVFDDIYDRCLEEKEIADVSRLALLKHFSEKKELSFEEETFAERELIYFTEREMYFSFYKNLPNRLAQEFQFYDKTFVEIHADPKKRICIHYADNDHPTEYVSEDMVNMYGGIYVKTFVIFFGDSISYYVTQEDENQTVVKESSKLSNNDVYGEYHESRYDLLNAILLGMTLGDDHLLEQKLTEYERQNAFVKEYFKLH